MVDFYIRNNTTFHKVSHIRLKASILWNHIKRAIQLRVSFVGMEQENKQKIYLEAFKIPEETLRKIREGIVKSIGFSDILKNQTEVLQNKEEHIINL